MDILKSESYNLWFLHGSSASYRQDEEQGQLGTSGAQRFPQSDSLWWETEQVCQKSTVVSQSWASPETVKFRKEGVGLFTKEQIS